MHAIGAPRTRRTAVGGIVEKPPRLVAELGARGPIEPRVRRTRMFLRDLGSLPVFDEEDRSATGRLQRGEGGIEVDVELIPPKDGDLRVVPRAAALLHRPDDGVRW